MSEYKIYFEIGGKKLKTTVTAKDEKDAVEKLRNKIDVHKVERAGDEGLNFIKDMLGIKF